MGQHDSRYHSRDLHWNTTPDRREFLRDLRALERALNDPYRRADLFSKEEYQRRATAKLHEVQAATRECVRQACLDAARSRDITLGMKQ